MKRSAFLIVGLSVLLPYLAGVLGHVTVADLDNRPVRWGGWWARSPASSRWRSRRGSAWPARCWSASWRCPRSRWPRSPGIRCSGWSGSRDAGGDRPLARRGEAGLQAQSAWRTAEVAEPRRPTMPAARSDGTQPAPKPTQGRRARPSQAEAAEEGRAAPGAGREGAGSGLGAWSCSTAPRTRSIDAGEGELDALQERLEETLAEFKVEGDVAGRTTGPVVTQYGVRLRPGVKMNRLVDLADDLALKMSARSIRVARIPGRDMVGVEVPNPKSRVVLLRELLEDEPWSGEERAAAGDAGPRPRGPAGHRRPGEDAAPADRRRDRHRQVGRHQRHHHRRSSITTSTRRTCAS